MNSVEKYVKEINENIHGLQVGSTLPPHHNFTPLLRFRVVAQYFVMRLVNSPALIIPTLSNSSLMAHEDQLSCSGFASLAWVWLAT